VNVKEGLRIRQKLRACHACRVKSLCLEGALP
jgi:hypothetical protein